MKIRYNPPGYSYGDAFFCRYDVGGMSLTAKVSNTARQNRWPDDNQAEDLDYLCGEVLKLVEEWIADNPGKLEFGSTLEIDTKHVRLVVPRAT